MPEAPGTRPEPDSGQRPNEDRPGRDDSARPWPTPPEAQTPPGWPTPPVIAVLSGSPLRQRMHMITVGAVAVAAAVLAAVVLAGGRDPSAGDHAAWRSGQRRRPAPVRWRTGDSGQRHFNHDQRRRSYNHRADHRLDRVHWCQRRNGHQSRRSRHGPDRRLRVPAGCHCDPGPRSAALTASDEVPGDFRRALTWRSASPAGTG
jgi:hypothetical protein